MKQLLSILFTLHFSLFVLLLASCKEDNVEVNSTFCNLPARFTMQNTYQSPVLYTACQSMGEFCDIKTDGKYFIIHSSNGKLKSDSIPIAADAAYSGYYLGLTGLVVGLPNIPEMGKDYPVVTCYDLACPNCYMNYSVTKPLKLDTGYATCKSCNRTYNLNDRGIIAKGDGGRGLFRYRTSYIGNTLLINNR